MKQRWVVACVVIVVGALGFWWWRHHETSDAAATPAVTQSKAAAPAAARAVVAEPAYLAVAVSDAKGAVANAIVRLAPEDGEVMVVHAGADGIAHAELAPGTWAASASAPEHEPGAAKAQPLAAGEHATIAIKLATGGLLLTGIATDATGGPISGVRIDAAKLDAGKPDRAIATTLTGTDGHYKLTVGTGALLVGAHHADYAPQARYVEVGASGATADFSLVPGGVIEGIVRDAATKQAVAGAEVTVERQGAAVFLVEAGMRETTSGTDGRFRITGLRPGAYELGAKEEARVARPPTHVGLGVAEQVTDVEILIAPAPVIRGIVVDENHAPAAGASVLALADGTNGNATAGPDGSFVLAGLHPGRWSLLGRGDAFVPGPPTQVELAAKDLANVHVVVHRGTKLLGHVEPRQVCDIASEPTGGGLGVMMMEGSAASGEDGEFAVGPLGPGKVTLTARCASGDEGSVVAEVPGAEVVVRVAAGGSIAGRVIDGEGKPIANVTVMGAREAASERTTIVNGMITSGVQALTTGTGAFELRGLPAGTFKLQVLDRGHALPPRAHARADAASDPGSKPVTVTLAAAEHKTGVELAVDRATGTIEGTVTGPDGKPLADAWVSAHQDLNQMLAGMMDPGAEGSRSLTIENRDDGDSVSDSPPSLTDASGHFVIAGLAHGHYVVVAEAQGGALRGRAPDVAPDATIAIQATGLQALHGTVHAASIPELFTVELAGPTEAQRSFAGGTTFDFARVDPGAYNVKVTSSAGNGEATVTVVVGQPATIDVTLVENAIVIGKLVDPAGHPLANLPIAVVPDSGDGRLQVSLSGPPPTSAADGSFRVETKAGKSALLVLIQPRPFHRAGLQLEAGKTLDLGTVTVTP